MVLRSLKFDLMDLAETLNLHFMGFCILFLFATVAHSLKSQGFDFHFGP